jgi:hypothetical protein
MTNRAATVCLGDTDVPRIGLGSNRLSHTDEHIPRCFDR